MAYGFADQDKINTRSRVVSKTFIDHPQLLSKLKIMFPSIDQTVVETQLTYKK